MDEFRTAGSDLAREADEIERSATRRQFLSSASLGLGAAALGSLLDPRILLGAPAAGRPASCRRPPLRPASPARHLPLPERRAVADRPVRLQAAARRTMNGQELPESVRMGQRLTGMTANQAVVPAAPGRSFKFAQHGQSGRLGERAAAAHREDRRRAVLRPARCTPRRSTTTRRSRSSRPGSQHRRPAEHRRVALLRPRQREREPARVRRAGLARRGRATSRSTRGCGAAASCRRSTRACSSARGKDPVLYLANPAGRRPRRAAGACSTRCGELERAAARARATRRSTRASRSTRWPTACRRRARSVIDLSRRAGRGRSSSTARTPASPAPSPPTACSRGGWPSAACASSSSITRAGTSTATCRRTSAISASDDRPGLGRARHRPEAARPARRHARHLGRRVRPHDLLAGQARRRTTTAATITRAASRSGWPAAA